MKFTIETKIFSDGLNVVSVAVDHRMSLPVLGNVKIKADGNLVLLSTSNLDLWVTQTLPANVSKAGAITVPFQLLQKLSGRLTSTETYIELSGKVLKLRSGEVNAILETLPEEEFPPTPTHNRENVTACDAKDLLTPLQKVSHAMSKDSSRYNLMGVNIEGDTFVATDGRRLAIYKGVELSKESVTLPDAAVRALLKINPTGEIHTFISDGYFALTSPTLEVVSKLIESTYPNWKQAVLPNGKHLFGCARKELIEALRTCAIFTDGITRALEMSGCGKEIIVVKDENVKARVMGSELAGQPKITKRFNSDYMLDALGVLENDNVTIRCSDEAGMVIEEGAFKTVINAMVVK